MSGCTPPEELHGFGTLLQFYDPIATQWVTVGGTNDIPFPDDTTEAVDTTSNDTEGGYKTSIPSPLSELGQVSYNARFRWAQWAKLVSMKANRTITDWRMVLMNPQQTYLKYCAWIQALGGEAPMEGLVMGDITLQPTGGPEWGQLL